MEMNNFKRWETPVSDADSLAMVSLTDRKNFEIILQDLRDSKRRRFKFTFEKVAAYINILEEYRTNETEFPNRKMYGWTIISENSNWLNNLKQKEDLLEINNPNCKHFIIITEDDVIEILCSNFPSVEEIQPANENEELPGKSTIYYHPKDKEEIDKLIDDIKKDSQKSG